MAITCPRCSRSIGDSTVPGEAPLFCMYCGQRLKPATADETVVRVVQPVPVSQLFSSPPEDAPPAEAEDAASTRSGGADPSDADPPNRDAAPSHVGGYRLVKFIGGGGMGNVYEAEDPGSGERVAVKLLSKRLSTSPASVERFRQEGRLASQLTHPRCVFVLRADTDGGRPFIVMELMPGETLKDVIDKRGPLPVAEAVGYILDVIDGLVEAHRLGVIHRDVKPSNCFLTEDGRVKVGDFGLSKSLAGDHAKQLTHSGTFLGTVLFAPPEQIRHEPVGYDSDVYAVAATLYYLLVGQAPHQHDSLTAVLAKAISEPAPPLRPKRPDVPKELERVVLRGLERDRARRYQTLEELRDALADLLPQNEAPAGVRALCLAYLIDLVLIQVVLFPLEMVWAFFTDVGEKQSQLSSMAFHGLFRLLYFGVCEGVFATTPGKLLFRLRVRRVGRTSPPGLGWALVRSLAFQAVWWVPVLAAMLVAVALGSFNLWMVFSPLAWVASVGVLLLQLRKTPLGHRGVHDLAAGTRVVQKRAPARRTRLVSRHLNPLDRVMPSEVPLPPRVGLFKVTGKLCDVDDGGQVWAGEDESLGRRVIVRIEPPGAGDDSRFDEPIVRPARLRAVGHGTLVWGGGERAWVAFVAPAGAPLPDVVSQEKPLAWADARGILEQVVGELIDGDADESAPAVVTPDQVWVEPTGRVQVLDFPLPTGKAVAAGETRTRYPGGSFDPFQFLRRTTTLMLEGRPRTSKAAVFAPLPPRTAELTSDLMGDRFRTLQEFQAALADDRQHPAEVSTGMRAGHISVTAVMCVAWLLTMFFMAGFVSFAGSVVPTMLAVRGDSLVEAVDTPDERAAWIAAARALATDNAGEERLARFERQLGEDGADDTLADLRADQQMGAELRRRAEARLNPVEIELLHQVVQTTPQVRSFDPTQGQHLTQLDGHLRDRDDRRRQPGRVSADDDRELLANPDRSLFAFASTIGLTFAILIAQWPLFWWPLCGLMFRGGAARWIAGLAFVRKDGRPASVWVCGLRSLLTWLPLLLMLWLVIAIQVFWPEWVYVRTFLWLLAVALLPLMAFLALRRPDRGPIDRLLGTYIVPA